jgi:hypothetical protein
MWKISHPQPSANTGNERMNAQQFFVAITDRLINLTIFMKSESPLSRERPIILPR